MALMLGRRKGQSIRIGDDAGLNVTRIAKDGIMLRIYDSTMSADVFLARGERVNVGYAEVFIADNDRRSKTTQVKLGIDAPKEIKILRGELVED